MLAPRPISETCGLLMGLPRHYPSNRTVLRIAQCRISGYDLSESYCLEEAVPKTRKGPKEITLLETEHVVRVTCLAR